MANPAFWVIIPARYASTRLPGKPLLEIAGKPMLQHVYERAAASGAARVVIATDDPRIGQAARGFGADVCMTAEQHQSGTDRIAEVARLRGAAADTVIVNLQGDEPLMPPALVKQAAAALADHPQAEVATLCEPLHERQAVFNPNIVKVARDKFGFALYFSRAPIPWLREEFAQPAAYRPVHYRHIGLYAYRAGFLQAFTGLPPAPLEQDEALEQLRVLYHGGKIYVAEACEAPGPGVDTPDDLERARALLK
jgi:3-deoxy-manno-octulosonate cytidylyltransferase (CMP-KDO synthetase)